MHLCIPFGAVQINSHPTNMTSPSVPRGFVILLRYFTFFTLNFVDFLCGEARFGYIGIIARKTVVKTLSVPDTDNIADFVPEIIRVKAI